MLPSHYCVPAIIEGVFLPRNSIPRIGIRSRQKWERISSRKLERDVSLDTLEEPRTWTSEQNYLEERNFSQFPSLNWQQ